MPTKKHCIIMGAAAAATFAYLYFVAKTTANARKVPVVAQAFNLGYNLATGAGVSIATT